MHTALRKRLPFLALAGLLPLAACGRAPQVASQPLVTDVLQSEVKRQAIGNCWLYAQAGWLESLLKTQTGESLDVSESYWTWWHWYDQLLAGRTTEIATGGSWDTGRSIILAHGYVLEGEFLADEAELRMSDAQAAALAKVNAALAKGGSLADPSRRTPKNIRRVLDDAFGSDMAAAEKMARTAAESIVARLDGGEEVSLKDALAGASLTRWHVAPFPAIYGRDLAPTEETLMARRALLRRVKKALNDRRPVLLSLKIDFNALDANDQATFKYIRAVQRGMGSQGGHLVVLQDYTVKAAPGFGDLGEGELSDEMKEAALDGELALLKAKNSWGTDRPERGLTDGYTRFDADYLQKPLPWKRMDLPNAVSWHQAASYFVLPPGY